MKLQFTSQPYQDAAFASVADLLRGDGDLARKYIRHGTMLLDSVGNTLPVSVARIQENLHAIQRQNGLPFTRDADKLTSASKSSPRSGTYIKIMCGFPKHLRVAK